MSYVKNLSYTGAAQTFTAPYAGYYKLELWGASGGVNCGQSFGYGIIDMPGGYGGFVSGETAIGKNDQLYVFVGQKGPDCKSTSYGTQAGQAYNGGGTGKAAPDNNDASGSGGGGTDVRIVSGSWNNATSLRSRIIVAGAGSGGSTFTKTASVASRNRVADGGGLNGVGSILCFQDIIVNNHSYNATQTSGYAFGIGADSINTGSNDASAGGGGGWYGGQTVGKGGGSGVCTTNANSAGGGSSYISGHTGSVGVTSTSSSSPKSGCTTGTTNNACSLTPYINPATGTYYTFTNTVMIDGAGYRWTNTKGSLQQMPNPSGGYYASGVGHSGNGYARITWLGTSI